MTISKDMVIGDLIALDQNFAAILMASGMGCVGCPSAQGETLEEYHVDEDALKELVISRFYEEVQPETDDGGESMENEAAGNADEAETDTQ